MGSFTFPYCGAVGFGNQVSLECGFSYIVMMLIQTLLEVNSKNTAMNFGFFFLVCCFTLVYTYFRVKPTEGL
jgi:hypothetical protein